MERVDFVNGVLVFAADLRVGADWEISEEIDDMDYYLADIALYVTEEEEE